ncbi:MAG: hypothetical protein CSB55_04255 [Candidatus Cloacimonadota bacterium]|nr:MAG: hypothetical protein CSB55_04255 [Candidatus Cloacimonadota bacterium]
MRNLFGLIIILAFASLQSVSIYDIQFTDDSSGDSPYNGEIVTVSGIVVAVGMNGEDDNIFIADPEGGAWNGIYVYACGNDNLRLGDEVEITGQVEEFYGQTMIKSDDGNIQVNLLSSNNPLPEPVEITTLQLSEEEMYEGVLVKISNLEVTEGENNFGEYKVSDGSGECQVDDNMFNLSEAGETIETGDTWEYICGLVDYSYGNFGLNPRFINDYYNPGMVFADFTTYSNTIGLPPLTVDFINFSHGEITSYQWDFDNNGTVDSEEENPSFTFTEPGAYDVKLTVSDGTNSNSVIKHNLVLIYSESEELGFKVMTYNSLFFGADDDSVERSEHFKSIIEYEDPDVIMFQEIENSFGAEIMLDKINEISGSYTGSDYLNGPYGPDCWLVFKGETGILVDQNAISTPGRNIMEYILDINGYELRFYVCHLKAGNSSEDKEQRAEEAAVLRNYLNQLPEDTEFIIAGDMNLYTHSEDAYEVLVDETADARGRAKDCSSSVGHWHNNPEFRWVHSQCPRVTSFGGSSGGGLDDRFDFILTNYDINDGYGIEYIENSYRVVGQDGNHYNQSVNYGTNGVVPSDIADDLYYASDHLPVVAEFSANPYGNDNDSPSYSSKIISVYPNPFVFGKTRSEITLNFYIPKDSYAEAAVYNTKGQKIKTILNAGLKAGDHKAKWDGRDENGRPAASGVYLFRISENGKTTGTAKSLLLK